MVSVDCVVPNYATLALQLFKNSIDTQGKLRLNLLSVSVSELLEYRRMFVYSINITFYYTLSIYFI